MKRRWTLLVLSLLLPSLLGLLIIGGAASSQGASGVAPAAIVNRDEIATLPNGQQLPGGRQIIAALTEDDPNRSGLDWSVVTADTAAEGLADGTYQAVVTIPEGFSDALVDVVLGDSDTPPAIEVRTSAASTDAAAKVAATLAQAAANEFGSTLTVSFLDESLNGMATLADGLGQAASGADTIARGQGTATRGAKDLTDGLTQADAGAQQLSTGAAELASGLGVLSRGTTELSSASTTLASGGAAVAGGASTLSDGIGSYTGGVAQLHAGLVTPQAGQAASLRDGAQQLAVGVDTYTAGVAQVHAAITQPLPGQTLSLQQGARQVAAGSAQLTAVASSLDLGAMAQGVEQLTQAQAGVQAFASVTQDAVLPLMTQCQAGDMQACHTATATLEQALAALQAGLASSEATLGQFQQMAGTLTTVGQQLGQVEQLAAGSQQVSAGIDAVAAGMEDNLVGTNAQALSTGAHGVAQGVAAAAEGAAQLAAGGQALNAGGVELASGTAQLSDGASALSAGAGQLSAGASEAAGGANQLAPGAAQLAQATTALSAGGSQLASGLSELTDGSLSLATGLKDAHGQIPSLSASEAESRAQAVASPIAVSVDRAEDPVATQWASTAVAIALWLSALVWVIAFGAMSRRRISQAYSPLAYVLRSSWMPAAVGAAASTVLVGTLFLAGISPARPMLLWFVVTIVAMALIGLHEALVAAVGVRGTVLTSVLLAIAQAVVLSPFAQAASLEGVFAAARGALLLPAAERAFAVLIHGSGSGSPGWVVVTAIVWLLVSLVVTVSAVAKRRRISLPQIRAAMA